MSGVFSVNDLKTPSAPSIFTEPTTYALFGTVLLSGFTQFYPRFFMPKNLYSGQTLRPPSPKVLIPGLVLPILGYSLALSEFQHHEIIRGHIIALLSTSYMAMWSTPFFHILPVCGAVGVVYICYAKAYHYRRLMLFTDETVFWRWSDFQDIKKHYNGSASKLP